MQRIAGGYYQEHSMMGDYIKDKFGDSVYTIGFIAHEGSFGFMRPRKIKSPKENSLEYLIGQAPMDNYFLPLKNITLEGYMSRPLAHQNMTTDIAEVMDGVIFNRYMRRPRTDWEFLLYLFPGNTMSAKKKERILQKYKEHKEKREIEKEQNRQKANNRA